MPSLEQMKAWQAEYGPYTPSSTNKSNEKKGFVTAAQDLLGEENADLLFNGMANSGIPIISGIGQAYVSVDNKQDALEQHEADKAWQAAEAEKARDHATSEREAAFADSVKMWEMNNEYNEKRVTEQREYDSLSSQVERAREAGLSPQVIAESGGKSTETNQSSAPTSSPGASPSAGAPNGIASQMLTSDAQVQALLSQAENNESVANLNKQQYDWNELTKSARYSEMLKNLKIKDASVREIMARASVSEQQFEHLKTTLPYLKDKSQTELKILKNEVNIGRNKWLLLGQEIQNMKQAYKNLRKTGTLLDAQIDTEVATKEQIDIQNKINELQRQQLKIVVDFSNQTGIPFGTDKFAAAWYLHEKGEYVEFIDTITEVSGAETEKMMEKQMDIELAKQAPNIIPPISNGDVIVDSPNQQPNNQPKNGPKRKSKRKSKQLPKQQSNPKPNQQSKPTAKRLPRGKLPVKALSRVMSLIGRLPAPMPIFPWQDPDYFNTYSSPTLEL